MRIRLATLLTAALMLVGTSLPASATEVNTSNSAGTVPVEITAEAALFSVTLPTSLPIHVGADGVVTVADNATIKNASSGPVKVSGVSITGANDWSIVAPNKDYSSAAMNLKEVGLTLNGDATTGPGALTLTASSWPSLGANATQTLTYQADVAPQSVALNQQVANVVLTVAWDLAASTPVEPEVPPEPDPRTGYLDKTALATAAKTRSTVSFINQPYATNLAPAGATVTDVSEVKDKSVMLVDDGTNAKVYGASIKAPENSSGLFEGFSATSLNVTGLDTSVVTSMNNLFYECANLTSVTGLESINTSRVASMQMMFSGSGLTGTFKVNWDTSEVIDATYMLGRTKFSAIDLSNLSMDKVSGAMGMFSECEASSILLPSGGMPAIRRAGSMFDMCSNLTALDARGINFSGIPKSSMANMLTGCYNLTSLRVATSDDLNAVYSMDGLPTNVLKGVSVG